MWRTREARAQQIDGMHSKVTAERAHISEEESCASPIPWHQYHAGSAHCTAYDGMHVVLLRLWHTGSSYGNVRDFQLRSAGAEAQR